VNIDLCNVSIDLDRVIKHISHDLRDDWYPDSLGYEDTLNSQVLHAALVESMARGNGLYIPEAKTVLNIPKKGFVLRYSLETSLLDRVYYQALTSYLIPFFDELLPPQVLSHRFASHGDRRDGRYLFKHPIEQWKLFEGFVLNDMETKSFVLVTDVQNYFENINVELLECRLTELVSSVTADGAEKGRIRLVITELSRCLKMWCYSEKHGLPQNRDASSFLANMVMLAVDMEMLSQGYDYYRYMDDIRITTQSKYEARKALQCLIVELRKIGLSVNSSKTKILKKDTDEFCAELQHGNTKLEQIDSMWRSRSLSVIRRSFEPLQQLAEELISGGRTQDRAFRFCIQRFKNIALCPEITPPPGFFDSIISASITALDDQPCSSDQIISFLKATETTEQQLQDISAFLKDEGKSIYDWQNYLLWQLFVYKQYNDPELLDLARRRLDDPIGEADKAGAILYLGSMGARDERVAIARSFDENDHHILQRNSLIAVHELEFDDGVEEHVADKVLPSLNGTYRRIRQSPLRGQYHRPLPSISYMDIYDEVTSYE
jgi:hypothetical protein